MGKRSTEAEEAAFIASFTHERDREAYLKSKRENEARDIAIRDGIGRRAQELGFKRKSEKIYERIDDEYRCRVVFRHRKDGAFYDLTGMTALSVLRLYDEAGVAMQVSHGDGRGVGHIRTPSIAYWATESRNSREEYLRRYEWLGPFRWLFLLEERWAKRDSYEQCPYICDDGWQPSDDPQACAEISTALWRENVEPWLDAMRDPYQYASWEHEARTGPDALARAANWVRAGHPDFALKLLTKYRAELSDIDQAEFEFVRDQQKKKDGRYPFSDGPSRDFPKTKEELSERYFQSVERFAACLGLALPPP